MRVLSSYLCEEIDSKSKKNSETKCRMASIKTEFVYEFRIFENPRRNVRI